MINFEEELARFAPIPEVNQTQDAIYTNDLKDICDIVSQVTAELSAKAHEVLGAFSQTEFLHALTDALLVRVQ